MDAPTKSGVIGMICCAMGLSRQATSACRIERDDLRDLAERLVADDPDDKDRWPRSVLRLLGTLAMGVRIDRPGSRWWDYHTVGAKVGLLTAQGKIKHTQSTGEIETLITRREYLADAGFLVALQGDASLIRKVADALAKPKWPVYLGRKSCPPTVPVLARPRPGSPWTNPMRTADLTDALKVVPWCPRYEGEHPGEPLSCLTEWRPEHDGGNAPADVEVWYDVPISFDPPYHGARFVIRDTVTVEVGAPIQWHTPPPPRPRANYEKKAWEPIRDKRLARDCDLCIFCKSPLTKYNRTVHHVTYRHAGGDESVEELRSLCRLCHDAVTMIEYGLGMGLDRINPEDPRWREKIIEKRAEIIKFRSLETRRRRLQPEEVE